MAPEVYDASVPETMSVDYDSNIARLRALIASGEVSVVPQPDTFLDDIPETETDVAVPPPAVAASYCLYSDDTLPYISAWPQTGLKLTTRGQYRVLEKTETILPAGTTTPEVVTEQLLALPLSPTPVGTPACLPSAVVGVTQSGGPIFNENPQIWSAVAAETLIGYARDGYPIYGRYDGVVDACGGYQSPTGYRYVISPTQTFIVGCYVAKPASFTF